MRNEPNDESNDMRGLTPENWLCVDCGVNTAPGCPTRIEIEQAFDAGEESVVVRYDERSEVYLVRNKIWERAGMEPMGGCLCVGCLERRLGRRLKPKDFPDHPFNNSIPGSPRLLKRQKRR